MWSTRYQDRKGHTTADKELLCSMPTCLRSRNGLRSDQTLRDCAVRISLLSAKP